MCNALRELFKDELEDARQEGRIEEISRLTELYNNLEKDGRREELLQALGNPETLRRLYEEYGLV